MRKKIRVGVIFGGKSAEHEVSLESAHNIIEAIDPEKYEVVPIALTKTGRWLPGVGPALLKGGVPPAAGEVALVPGSADLIQAEGVGHLDVIFPVLHGPFGEDGTMQGLLKLANLPFVGASVLGSAVGMDKEVMKRLLRESGLPIGKFMTLRDFEKDNLRFGEVIEKIGLPFFVKPANLGSSIGVRKVKSEEEFGPALADAFQYDRKILLEEFIPGREIECSVLGNDRPEASLPGEILPKHEFYSYEAKYLDENGAVLEIPAKLGEETVRRVQELAIRTFQVLACEGMGRVDFFLRENGEVLVNEINTIPGFTKISMYPKLWEASGMSYRELIDRLIELAVERFEKEQKLKTAFSRKEEND